jgi:hypothetical protein
LGCAEAARAACAVLLGALSGCAIVPPPIPGPLPFPGVAPDHDLRADYRAVACAKVPAGSPPCDSRLRVEAGEGPLPMAPLRDAGAASRYRVGFVPGLFAECIAPLIRPFGDAEVVLRTRGYDVTYFDVPGRGSVVANARFLAERIDRTPADARPWILVTYSKGLADALEYVVNHTREDNRVAAIVSFAGAALGSPLADVFESSYREYMAGLPIPGCSGGTGAEIDDLRRESRHLWWSRNGSRVTVPVLGVVATASPNRVSVGSWTTYRKLSEIDPRNDGKILWSDQLVPGGWLLGFVDADHWSIAVPLRDDLPALAFLFHDDIPRPALVEGAIEVAAGLLAREAKAR